jgi:hypothetical protein
VGHQPRHQGVSVGINKFKVIYAIMQRDIKVSVIEYNDELKKELDKRYTDYKKRYGKIGTATESKKRIQKVLKATAK